MTREGAEVVDLAAHREERAAVGHPWGTDEIDDTTASSLTT